MPLITSTYQSPFYLFNGHLETIVPSAFRKINLATYQRERLELLDGDFLDLDWIKTGCNKLVIISHGLEGSSERHYSKGMAYHFSQNGWDALAWNCRSCSGEMNRLPRFYHHGDTTDLKTVIEHAQKGNYKSIALVGLSMGGGVSLKYLGEYSNQLPDSIIGAIGFSVPCHLGSSAAELDKPSKSFYRNRFLRKLRKKIEAKAKLFPNEISSLDFDSIKTFEQFDNRYSAPLHGFKDAKDFYEKASCEPFLSSINVPVLIVNAENDPFLPGECYPKTLAKEHKYVHLEIPNTGGHVGFSIGNSKMNWMEKRALEFLTEIL
jgi:predicted alpha/beta-fold hydrolase